jgi:hypothetical protein
MVGVSFRPSLGSIGPVPVRPLDHHHAEFFREFVLRFASVAASRYRAQRGWPLDDLLGVKLGGRRLNVGRVENCAACIGRGQELDLRSLSQDGAVQRDVPVARNIASSHR